MIIESRYELLALHRALFEAKFVTEPRDRDIAGSTFVADIANRVVAELATDDPSWHEWRKATGHPERVEVVRRRVAEIAGSARWKEWSPQERRTYVEILLSPLTAEPTLLEELSGR